MHHIYIQLCPQIPNASRQETCYIVVKYANVFIFLEEQYEI